MKYEIYKRLNQIKNTVRTLSEMLDEDELILIKSQLDAVRMPEEYEWYGYIQNSGG